MTIIWIIGALFIALAVLLPLIEKFGPRLSQQNTLKMRRWILPLIALSLIIQLFIEYGRSG